MEIWGKIVKGQAKMKAKGKKDGGDDEVKAIFDSFVAEQEEARRAAASGKNLPTESLSLYEIPSFPATIECWGKIVKGEAKMKAKGKKDGGDGEVKAIFDSFVAEQEEARRAAASGKNLPTESLSLYEILSFPATIECWGKIVKGEAKMKAKGKKDGGDDEVKAIFDSFVAEQEEAKKAAVSGKKRPTESASETPANEKKAKLIFNAGQKTGGNERKGADTATPHPAKTGKDTCQ